MTNSNPAVKRTADAKSTASSEATASPAATPGPLKLPLVLKILRLRHGNGQHVHVDCRILDSQGQSVQFMPITMGPDTAPAEVCAILQGTVDVLAKAMYKRGDILLEDSATNDADFDSLIGKEFTGSVAT